MFINKLKFIIGADEVGKGSWAGPLCIGAVCAPSDWHFPGLRDSKAIKNITTRERLSAQLWSLHDQKEIICVVEMIPNTDIDAIGIAVVQKDLFVSCLNRCLQLHPEASDSSRFHAIVDGNLRLNQTKLHLPYQSVVDADAQYPTVMAASIIAKVHRDNWMRQQACCYPGYGWETNVGYGAKRHRQGLETLGLTPLHRLSFKPMKTEFIPK